MNILVRLIFIKNGLGTSEVVVNFR
jgi:hypothetical protein